MSKRFDFTGTVSDPDNAAYVAHNGQTIEVVRQLTTTECDAECQPMWLIRATDGWEGHAFDDELLECQP